MTHFTLVFIMFIFVICSVFYLLVTCVCLGWFGWIAGCL